MTVLSDLQDLLTKLRKARVSGVLETQHGDTRVRFKSDGEMAAAIADLQQQINSLGGGTTRGPRYIHQTGKGL